MKKSATTRRNFLQTTAAGAVGIVLARPKILAARASGSIGIDEPFHGAVLNRRHGKQVSGGLEIQVSGQAPLRDRVTVNGTPARREGTRFTSEIVLHQKQTEIIATSQGSFGRHEHPGL